MYEANVSRQPSIKEFLACESGAVTVDWVVLTAAIAGLGIGVLTAIELSMTQVTTEMATDMASSSDISDLASGGGAPGAADP
jgi:hypothetical protein